MKINRRDLLVAGGLSLVARPLAFAQTAAPPTPQSQTPPGPAARLLDALQRNRLPLTMGDTPTGPGWDWIVQQARAARFTLLGEQNGVAETARLSSALFTALQSSGYSRMAVQLSPVIAEDIEAAGRRGGLNGIVELLKNPGVFTFSNLREEVQFFADVLKVAKGERVLWGLDRELFSDRYLISRLEARVPAPAREAFTRLKEASMKALARFQQEPNGDNLFLLSEDPALVSAVRAAWPDPDRESDAILRTLEGSLAIEAAERAGGLWPYAQRRTEWMRSNFAARLKEEQGRNVQPKVMMRLGYTQLIRGANYLNVFDLGTMVSEAAALTGDLAFHVIVLPGPGSRQAVLGQGRSFGSVATDDFDDFNAGDGRLTRVLPNPNTAGHEVIDLRALRPLATRGLESWNADVIKTIHGYDAAVIWKAAHAASGLE